MDDVLLFTIKLIISSLAVWRVSSAFSRESGPLSVFVKIRMAIFSISADLAMRNAMNAKKSNVKVFLAMITQSFSDGLACMWCNSIWFSAIISLTISTNIIDWIINTLAISSVAIFMEECYGNCKDKNAVKS